MAKEKENNRNLPLMSIGQAKAMAISMIKSLKPADCPSILNIGPVGAGKTETWKQVAEECGLSDTFRHFSQIHPLDVAGVGLDNVKREMYFARPPLVAEVMSKPAPRLLVLDEIDRAAPLAQSALLQVLSEKRLNGYHLEDTYVVAAANAWYAQYTFELDKAMTSRLCIAHVLPRPEEWLIWAGEHNVDPRVIITIASAPDVLNQQGEMNEGAMKVADPRAWVNLSKALRAGVSVDAAPLFVGEHAAQTFMRYANFARDYSKEIAQVVAGKRLELVGVKTNERDNLLFGIYLAAAGQINTIPAARQYLVNGCAQIGDEKTYIAGRLLTYNIPTEKLTKDPDIQKIHQRIAGKVIAKGE